MKKYKKDSQTEKSSGTGCLFKAILILGILFVIIVIVPNYKNYKEKKDFTRARSEKMEQIFNTIQSALATYAKKNPEIGYPHQISDYGDLRNIVNQYGGALPENQSEVFIKKTHYCSDSGKDYKMVIEIYIDLLLGLMEEKFFIITPKDVTRRWEISDPKSDCNTKEVD